MYFMNRRTFLKTTGVPALLTPLRGAAVRPNILIVMTDQQFSDAMSFRIGRKYLHTPHMDSLAATGAVFTRAYCPNPLCVPSRTSMFTGRYPAETGVETNDTTPIDARRFPMMGSIFRKAGYNTAYFGKWHLPYPQADTELHGFETGGRAKMKGDDSIAAAATNFLRSVKRDAPFLAVTSLLNPHNICEWARGQDLPDGPIPPLPPPGQCPPVRPNLEPQKNEPDIMTLMRRSYQATKMFPVGGFDVPKWRQYVWAYYRMIEKVDGLVGQVLGGLRESGLEQNTLVIFLADHGDCQGAHRWNQKTVFYDEAARVPFILSQKGVTKPSVSDALVHTGVDLIPTMCAYAGIPIPPELPGVSLKGAPPNRDYVVVCNKMVQGAPIDGRVPEPDGRMLRSGRHKYCIYSEGKRRESLVDMQKDPGEMVNLADSPAHRDILLRHRAMFAEWQRKTKDTFPAVT